MAEIYNTYLIVSDQVYRINAAVTKIGRSLDNHLVITSANVSRQHAEIRYENDEYKLFDNGSTGGTFHNGVRIEKCSLNSGDSIQLAEVPVIFARNPTNMDKQEKASTGELKLLGPDNEPTILEQELDWRS
ncbi:MAG: FHA domain-containing protein [Chloroflexota bacterium]